MKNVRLDAVELQYTKGQLVVHEAELVRNQFLHDQRVQFVLPSWESTTGLKEGQVRDLHWCIWAWGKKPRKLAAGEDLESDDDGAEWPYEEDCYPKGGDDWATRLCGNDQWHLHS